MTNKEKYKQAFSSLHLSGKISLEVEEMAMMRRKSRFQAAVAAVTVGLALAGGGVAAYAADVGGIQRTIQLWINGDKTDAVFEYNADGTYTIHYPSEEGHMEEHSGGGVAIETDGSERPLTEGELMDSFNSPEVEYKDDGTVWLYYYDQKIEITDKFEDGVCYVKVSKGDETLYVTVQYQKGWYTSPHKYQEPELER